MYLFNNLILTRISKFTKYEELLIILEDVQNLGLGHVLGFTNVICFGTAQPDIF